MEIKNMKRKIIKQGHNTLTITLPSEWTRRLNLEAGKEIELEEKENGLFISSEKNGKHKQIEFNIKGMDIPTIWKYFSAVYREGYNEIIVRFDPSIDLESPYKYYSQYKMDVRYGKKMEKKPIVEVLQGFVNRFIGFEIIEHGKDYILIRDMGETTSKEFDNSFRRVFFIVQQMAEELVDAIDKNDPLSLRHMHDVDINLGKFHDFCIRILNKTGNKELRKASLYFSILYLLEMVGDEFKNIVFHLVHDFDKANLKHIREMAVYIKELIDGVYEMFYKFEIEKIRNLSELDKKLYLRIGNIYKGTNEEEKEVIHHLRIIEKYLTSIPELRIEMEF